ncbi:hypothetical protein KTO58_01405 [Chitinophaga pendula]|uniref:hypothetical protein n=1 Tax=Chitinophaga TaxID=79328 RepID=UPI0012FD2B55|nr:MULTISPECIES: hypothetical protein [Chitinophaga]UCJ07863.1 hypothetical protein KTO58_01405 [Chitinophaga pendula]
MKKISAITVIISLWAAIVYVSSCNSGQPEQKDNSKPPEGIAASSPQTPLSPDLPYDVTFLPGEPLVMETTVRRRFDIFSWDSFIALCWPTQDGEVIGQFGDNPTVWETWKTVDKIFLDDGKDPTPWDSTLRTQPKLLSQTGKVPPELSAFVQPFNTGPLIDQNGEYARFEIAVNQEMFNYIDQNKLYNIDGQQTFSNTVIFPSGNDSTKQHGAIMVKASWKILGKGDDTSRFHKTMATVYATGLPSRGIKDTIYKALVGLVGLHIGTKTVVSPQWIWSTFEHVDNVPDFTKRKEKQHYNFYNAEDTSTKRLNRTPAQPWCARISGQRPSQVARLTPIDTGTQHLNDSMRTLLTKINPKSVWQYYKLVGTQWPVNPAKDATGDPFPVFMANATLETYDQGNIQGNKITYTPNVSSSCISCHNGATSWTGHTSDFTYILRRAKAVKK